MQAANCCCPWCDDSRCRRRRASCIFMNARYCPDSPRDAALSQNYFGQTCLLYLYNNTESHRPFRVEWLWQPGNALCLLLCRLSSGGSFFICLRCPSLVTSKVVIKHARDRSIQWQWVDKYWLSKSTSVTAQQTRWRNFADLRLSDAAAPSKIYVEVCDLHLNSPADQAMTAVY